MRDLEEKEKELNKLKMKADGLLNNDHPASDKIQVSCCFLSWTFTFCEQQRIPFVLMTMCSYRPTWTPCRPSGVGSSRSPSVSMFI